MPFAWTYEENAMLVKIVNDYEGRDWAAISEFFPQRTQEACASHYHACLKQHHAEWLKVSSPIMGAMFLITKEELAAYEAQRPERLKADAQRQYWSGFSEVGEFGRVWLFQA